MKKPLVTILKSALGFSGGLEKYTWRITAGFKQLKWPIRILTADNSSQCEPDPYLQIIHCAVQSPFSFRKVIKFDHFCNSFLDKYPSEIVLGLDRNSHQTHLRAGNGVHAAYLNRRASSDSFFKRFSYSLNPLHNTLLHLEKTAFENPDLRVLITNSNMVRKEVFEHYKIPETKVITIHNGVEWKEMEAPFQQSHSFKGQILRTLNLPEDRFHFLFIGNNFKRKGLDLLLYALARLKDEKKGQFHLSVIGKDRNQSRFIKLSHELGLSSNVTFFGQKHSSQIFYQIADCLVIPSLYDPFANVTLEALAMGLYVVSSKSNGGSEILQEYTGSIVDSIFSKEEFAYHLGKAMELPKIPDRALRIRKSVEHLDFSIQIPKIIQACLT